MFDYIHQETNTSNESRVFNTKVGESEGKVLQFVIVGNTGSSPPTLVIQAEPRQLVNGPFIHYRPFLVHFHPTHLLLYTLNYICSSCTVE